MSFEIVPVLDLMGGLVVRAVAGDRDRYRPLGPGDSRIVSSARPREVVNALLALHPFRRFYIADLDAIRKQGDQRAVVESLERAFPQLEFWVDAGFSRSADVSAFRATARSVPVLGSETLADPAEIERLPEADSFVLSLDFRGTERLGPEALFERPELWPPKVIVMTLGRVGSRRGPDLPLLAAHRQRAPEAAIYAAGGVRDAADLRALRRLGCAGALVATLLHAGALDGGTIEALQKEPDSREGHPEGR